MKHTLKQTIKLNCNSIEKIEIPYNTNHVQALLAIGMLDITAQSHTEPFEFDQFLTCNTDLSKAITACKDILSGIRQHIQIVSLLLARTDDEEVAENLSQVGQLLLWLTELEIYLSNQKDNMELTHNLYLYEQ